MVLTRITTWLITSGQLDKASNIIGSEWRQNPHQSPHLVLKIQSNSYYKTVFLFLKDYLKLFSTLELTKRTLICNYMWFMENLYYFIITLSGSNFEVNQYLYLAFNGISEMPGYLLPILFLTNFGRKHCAPALCIVAGIAMLVIIVLPQGWPIISISLIGRLMVAAGYGIIMFPTENRNTPMGSCITSVPVGPLLVPYLVDILGKKVWWLPTAISGSLALLGAFFMMFLPETKDTPMLDTISEIKELGREAICKGSEKTS